MRTVIALLATSLATVADAQVPYIVGTWQLDHERSEYPGPVPETEIRQYRLLEDGWLVALAVVVGRGNINFLQVTARTDGEDYPEYSAPTLAELQKSGTATRFTYAETNNDSHTVDWINKVDGRVYLSGTRNVSEDGRELTIVATAQGPGGQSRTFTLVYSRVDPPE
jgi:hypothetical protein